MSYLADDKILKKIIGLCDDVAWGRSIEEKSLYSYTAEGVAPENLRHLAEAFGFMLVKLGIREEYNTRLIQELKEKNEELEQAKEIIQQRNSKLMEVVQSSHSARRMIGQCEPMQKAIKFALSIAKRPVNTLLLGATGTGKEEFAKLIHYNSSRCEKPFIAVNCSAIPDSLFESEMFGIEKGVATGVLQKKGLLEEANGGTLFLDEIADMPLMHQVKLLRVLEEQAIVRVGSAKPIPLDIKVIAAANINIEHAIEMGTFRVDLYYRLNVAEIQIPALKDRGDDILLLAQNFLDHHCLQMRQKKLNISVSARKALLNYPWPGNVRELKNEMERAVVLALGKSVELFDLSPKIGTLVQNTNDNSNLIDRSKPLYDNSNVGQNVKQNVAENVKEEGQEAISFSPNTSQELKKTQVQNNSNNAMSDHGNLPIYNLLELEKKSILQALDQTQGNRSQAAFLLGITREGLRKKMLRMKILPAKYGNL